MRVNPYLYRCLISMAAFFGHLYISWNLTSSSFFKRTKLEIIFTVVGTCFVCFVMFKFRVPNVQVLRIVYYFFTLWFGLFMVCFMCSCFYHVLELLQLISPQNKGKLVMITTLALFIYGLINAYVIHTVSIDVKLKGPLLKTPVKIAHLSDLHLGSIYRKTYVQRICRKLEELKPDFVVITGDLFDGNVEFEYDLISPFDQLQFPVYFIMGNHDLLYPSEILSVLKRSKMKYLNDNAVVKGDLQLIGINYVNPRPNIKEKLERMNLKPNMVNVLLYHCPAFDVDLLSGLGISVHLAGHTHGGQIFPVHFLQKLNYKYLSGLYKSKTESSYVYVSQGVGTTGVPLRIATEPTIALINLHSDTNNTDLM